MNEIIVCHINDIRKLLYSRMRRFHCGACGSCVIEKGEFIPWEQITRNTELDENEYAERKRAEDLFTDREEPRKAFWDITRLENEIDSALKSGLKGTTFEATKDVATMTFNIPVVGSIAAAVSSVYGGVKPLVEKKIKENGSDKKDRKRETGA